MLIPLLFTVLLHNSCLRKIFSFFHLTQLRLPSLFIWGSGPFCVPFFQIFLTFLPKGGPSTPAVFLHQTFILVMFWNVLQIQMRWSTMMSPEKIQTLTQVWTFFFKFSMKLPFFNFAAGSTASFIFLACCDFLKTGFFSHCCPMWNNSIHKFLHIKVELALFMF